MCSFLKCLEGRFHTICFVNETVSLTCLGVFVQGNAVEFFRKREIISLLCHMGHEEVLSMVGNPKIGHQLHDIFYEQNFKPLTIEYICEQLAMSESTLRRKLKAEGTNLQEIKDQARLSFGLHLLQTSDYSIILIADKCGYQS